MALSRHRNSAAGGTSPGFGLDLCEHVGRRVFVDLGGGLLGQISMFPRDCAYYLGPTRAAAKVATTDQDRHTVGVLLAEMATCVSNNENKCDEARQILKEAQVFIPALAFNELNAACR